jgi:Bifunctional DNA primase/polymerase, N-terminal
MSTEANVTRRAAQFNSSPKPGKPSKGVLTPAELYARAGRKPPPVGNPTKSVANPTPAAPCKLDHALDHARRGFDVFPLIPNTKLPAIKDWPNRATQDPAKIRQWWAQWPNANIGICTTNLLVVDIDTRNGGHETFAALSAVQEFPPTAEARTPSGGRHLFYRLPPHTHVQGGTGKLGPGVDVKSYGGQVVGAGSTIDGGAYVWVN